VSRNAYLNSAVDSTTKTNSAFSSLLGFFGGRGAMKVPDAKATDAKEHPTMNASDSKLFTSMFFLFNIFQFPLSTKVFSNIRSHHTIAILADKYINLARITTYIGQPSLAR